METMDNIERPEETPQSPPQLIVKIISAHYMPCEGKRLLSGELCNDETVSIPLTRDVAPFLRALLIAQQRALEEHSENIQDDTVTTTSSTAEKQPEDSDDPGIIRMNAITGQYGMKRARISVLDGMKSMNAVFGDPAPGVSKRLHVSYTVTESTGKDRAARAAKTRVHRMSFAEHEKVILKRKINFYQEEASLKEATERAMLKHGQDEDEVDSTLLKAKRMGRSMSIAEFAQDTISEKGVKPSPAKAKLLGFDGSVSDTKDFTHRTWRLRSATSEIVLPIVLPFLTLRERVHCQLVCRLWRNIIRSWGVATTIDNNDESLANFNRAFLRGLLSHSYASLHSLFLSGFEDLQQSDLHPSIPYLRKLRSLDISRCFHLDDSTMYLLAEHCSETLEVLYLKGLRRVSDDGIVALSESCSNLTVLEISYVPITDKAGVAIGENLTKLKAIYMRDNYLLTNRSIDIITEHCTSLEQLTLWGCNRLKYLTFDRPDQSGLYTNGKLVMLNLWGCHCLGNDTAKALVGMSNLRSLIVSECHRMTDGFVNSLVQVVPQLHHLHLRYCRRLTDTAVYAIAHTMRDLYSLDLSFCTLISASAINNLLLIRRSSLAELRIQSCRNLDITSNNSSQSRVRELNNGGEAGRELLRALTSEGDLSCLCVLDVRSCGGQSSITTPYPEGDPFVQGMMDLGFQQKVPGFFSRSARWNSDIENRLVSQVFAEYADTRQPE